VIPRIAIVAVGCALLVACGPGSASLDESASGTGAGATVVPGAVAATGVPATEALVAPATTTSIPVTVPEPSLVTSVAPATVATSTEPPTTVADAPAVAQVETTSAADDFLGEEILGYSVQGRPIMASHRGTAGGTVVLVVGVIHGNENAGIAILDALRALPVPVGVDLWLMDAVNPDGLANDERGNGNQVDLNRNFPHDWTPIAQVGEWEYSGTGPASEPETQAFIAFAQRIQPELTLWYHQDLFRISPSSRRDGPLRERYAQLTGLPVLSVTGGTYTGVAATWTRTSLPDAMSFIIELGPALSADEAVVHASAVLDIVTMI